MLLSFNVQKQIITRTDTESVVCNSMNFLYAQFTFSEEWAGTKTAVFKGKERTYNALLDENNSCLVPWEVLTESWFYVSVFCGNLVTANKVTIYTIPSGYEIGDESRIPTPEIYVQVINRLNEIEQEIDPEAIERTVDAYLADKDFVTEADVESIVSQYVSEHVHGLAPGGTTGQVLVKSSDADYDTEWGDVTSDGVVIPSGLSELYNINHTTVDSWLSTYVTFADGVLTEKAHPTSTIGAHYQITDANLEDYDLRAKIRVNVVSVSGEWTCRLEYLRYDGTKASWAIPFGTITQAGEIVLEIDLANLSVYYNYAGGGVDFRVMNVSHGESDTIVIDAIDTLVGNGLNLGGDNVTEVLETLNTNLSGVSVDVTNLKDHGLSLTAPNGCKYKLVVANDGTLSTALDYPNNILYIGNSLLLGFGTHGMASTTVNDDYYAKVNDFIEDKGITLTTDRVLGKPLEETTSSEEVQTWITNNLASKMSASVQMVIIQLGDNVNTYQQREFFPSSMETLVNYLRQNCPNAKIAWVGCWYSGSSIDNILIPKCTELSVPFVSIDGLFEAEGNQSYIGAPYIDASGNEKTVTTAGQASHPSDQGFTAIANIIIDALFT